MAIVANVKDGVLDYNYTDNGKKEPAKGSDLGYDQFLQLLCAEMQYQDPLEPTSNTDYVAQLATFSQLEATLEQTSTQQGNMANNLVGKEVVLKVENEKTGSTNYVEGKVDYVMYQDGEIYLSVNNGLYPLSSLDTVADPSYYDAVTLSKTFSGMVDVLPEYENATYAYEGAIKQMREMFDGMSSYEKSFLKEDDVKKFLKIEERVNELVAAKKQAEAALEQIAGAIDASKKEETTEDTEESTEEV